MRRSRSPTSATERAAAALLLLALGASPVSVGSSAPTGDGGRIVLTADGAGHFWGTGTINGKTVRFMVDTGATNIGIGQSEAERLGLDWKKGEPGMSGTASGAVPVYYVSLGTVRVGDVQLYDIPATVLPSQMPFVLLGNSFLNRFQMRRENDKLTLERGGRRQPFAGAVSRWNAMWSLSAR